MSTRRGFLSLAALVLAGCAAKTIPATAHLPRPARIYVEDFHAPAATALVDTNQFSYVMEGLDYPRDTHSREADAAAAQAAVRETLISELRALGFDARPGSPATFSGDAVIIAGSITNIIEALPSQLATLEVGAPRSQVNARSVVLYRPAGQAPRRWQEFTVNAPVVPSPEEAQTSAGAYGTSIAYLPPQSADIRTRDVALQAHRLALRLVDRLRTLFAAEGWLSPTPAAK
ncbi:MAG: hypothetical protein ACP5M5_08210 [Acidibrevibacterium sp.]|uniref:hypothetical protein n=1 Tax=Acidibrevibacterium sp. TaxID=2606776 RepID=UPI003CFEA2A3